MRDRNYYNRFPDSDPNSGDRMRQYREHRQKNRVFFGILLALVGAAFLLRELDILPYYAMLVSWPIILIIIGIMIGIKNNFRRNAWWILIIIGAANLTPQFTIHGHQSSELVWPALIMLFGLVIAFRPRKDKYCAPNFNIRSSIITESSLNIEATFGGRKEVVTSKDFKGGVINITFAGCELNLAQADFTEPSVVLECKVAFGGLEIVVPSHWEIQNEVNPSFGSVEDERTIQTPTTSDNKKILILRGNCSFGSIELKSY